jgi:hypothetical protein
MRYAAMDPRFEQFLETLNHHRVAVVGLAVAMVLGVLTGGVLKPTGLLDEPMAAQLIASEAQAANGPAPLVLEPFPANTANRPWVVGTDYAKLDELPRLAASYDDRSYEQTYAQATDEAMPLSDSTPSVDDRAVDAVATESSAEEPAA